MTECILIQGFKAVSFSLGLCLSDIGVWFEVSW